MAAARRDFGVQLFESSSKKAQSVRLVLLADSIEFQRAKEKSSFRTISIEKVDDVTKSPQLGVADFASSSCFGRRKGSLAKLLSARGVQIVLGACNDSSEPEVVHLLAESEPERDALRTEVKRMMARHKKDINDRLEAHMFDELIGADKNKDDLLSLDEVQRFVHNFTQFNVQNVPAIFQKLDKNGDASLDFGEFKHLCYELWSFAELDETYERHSVAGRMSETQFGSFLNEELQIRVAAQHLSSLFENALNIYEISDTAKQEQYLTLTGFRKMYLSGWELLSIFDYPQARVYQDMTKPLNYYWISSSHNTYLEGAQLLGTASASAYKRTLLEGARCVELDVYDGKREPEVRHGQVSSRLSLRDALKAIAEAAFTKSEYPLILTVEDNMKTQQPQAAHIIREVLQGCLYTRTGNDLPSPEALKGKIVVRVGISELDEEGEERPSTASGDFNTKSTSRKSTSSEDEAAANCSKGLKVGRYLELNKVGGLRRIKFKSFGQAYKKYGVFSFNERLALDYIRNQRTDFVNHTSKYLVRIYPQGNRIFSGNYAEADAATYWNAGAQIVAFNMQTTDSGKLLNRCLFNDNGRCGYVLKPNLASASAVQAANPSAAWKFEIFKGFRFPNSHNNMTNVKVKLSVVGIDASSNGPKETAMASMSYPVWNSTLQLELGSPASDFLKIEVVEAASGAVLFHHLIRVCNIGRGLRAIPLFYPDGKPCETGALFARITVQQCASSSGRPSRPSTS